MDNYRANLEQKSVVRAVDKRIVAQGFTSGITQRFCAIAQSTIEQLWRVVSGVIIQICATRGLLIFIHITQMLLKRPGKSM